MEFILVIGVFEAVFLAALLFSKNNKSTPDYVLGIFFILYGINIFLSFMEVYNRKHGYPYPFFIHTATPWILLHGPALWFYIKSLTDQHFRFKTIYLLHFIPFVLVLAEHIVHFYTLSVEAKIEMAKTETFKTYLSYPVIVSLIAVSTIGYIIWGLMMIRKYNHKIRAYFSKVDDIDLRWLKFLLVGSLYFYILVNLLFAADVAFRIASFGMLQLVTYAFGSVYILILGFYGLKQGNVFSSKIIQVDLEEISEEKSVIKTEVSAEEKFIQKLKYYMQEKKPYLDPEINIAKISNDLNVSPEYLSQVLNTKLKHNFFDFINTYRVDEFKQQLKDHKNQHLTLIGIAYNSGFNSKPTFNRVFKRFTGLTPSLYLQQVSEN
jgi:AraC-like DNA-binding protein